MTTSCGCQPLFPCLLLVTLLISQMPDFLWQCFSPSWARASVLRIIQYFCLFCLGWLGCPLLLVGKAFVKCDKETCSYCVARSVLIVLVRLLWTRQELEAGIPESPVLRRLHICCTQDLFISFQSSFNNVFPRCLPQHHFQRLADVLRNVLSQDVPFCLARCLYFQYSRRSCAWSREEQNSGNRCGNTGWTPVVSKSLSH